MKLSYTLSIITIMLFSLFTKSQPRDYDKSYEAYVSQIKKMTWDDEQAVVNLIQPTVLLDIGFKTKEKLGCSKKGGKPDLPMDIKWPTYNKAPMVFFGQLNLEEMAKFHKNENLPKKGILYFFAHFDAPENEFGAEFEFIPPKRSFKVIYQEDISNLNSTPFPSSLPNAYHFNAEVLIFDILFSLPPSLETGIIETSNLSEHDQNQLIDFTYDSDYGFIDQSLGIPVPMQYGVDFDWVIQYLDIDLDDYKKDKTKYDEERCKFVNLFATEIFESIGDCNAYFGIHLNDLKQLNFDKAVFITQGT